MIQNTPTPIFTAQSLDVNTTQPEMVKPSVRARIITKVATARLAILQSTLRVRDGFARASEKIFSLFKRSKNNSMPTPTVSPLIESPVNKSPVKQNSPVAQLSPFEFKAKTPTPQQTPLLTPFSSDVSDISSVATSPISEQLTPDFSPIHLDREPAEVFTPVMDEIVHPTPTEGTPEASKEAVEIDQNSEHTAERVTSIYQKLMPSQEIKKALLVGGSMALGGLIVHLLRDTFDYNRSLPHSVADYNKGHADGWQECLNVK